MNIGITLVTRRTTSRTCRRESRRATDAQPATATGAKTAVQEVERPWQKLHPAVKMVQGFLGQRELFWAAWAKLPGQPSPAEPSQAGLQVNHLGRPATSAQPAQKLLLCPRNKSHTLPRRVQLLYGLLIHHICSWHQSPVGHRWRFPAPAATAMHSLCCLNIHEQWSAIWDMTKLSRADSGTHQPCSPLGCCMFLFRT